MLASFCGLSNALLSVILNKISILIFFKRKSNHVKSVSEGLHKYASPVGEGFFIVAEWI